MLKKYEIMSRFLRKQISAVLDYLSGQIKLANHIKSGQVVLNAPPGYSVINTTKEDLDAADISFDKFIQTLGRLYTGNWLQLDPECPQLFVLKKHGRYGLDIDIDMELKEKYPFYIKTDLLEVDIGEDSRLVSQLILSVSDIVIPKAEIEGRITFEPSPLTILVKGEVVFSPNKGSNPSKIVGELWLHRQVLDEEGTIVVPGKAVFVEDLYRKIGFEYTVSEAESRFKGFRTNMEKTIKSKLIKFSGTRKVQMVVKR